MEDDPRESGNTGAEELKPIIDTANIKAFIAGVVVGNISKGLTLGFAIGAVAGVLLQQNNSDIPDVKDIWTGLINRWKESDQDSKK